MVFTVRPMLALGLAMLGFAGALHAECPAPRDLATGIALRDDAGGVTVFRPGSAPGEVTETTLFDDNTGFFVRSAGGLLVQESHDLENGAPVAASRIETVLERPEAAFPVAEGRSVAIPGVERVEAEGSETPVTVTVETSLLRRVVYGDCVVSAIPVRMRYTYKERVELIEHLDYLPDFGIALFLGAGEAGTAPDIYRVIELFKAPPE